jgi:hypothetical protein
MQQRASQDSGKQNDKQPRIRTSTVLASRRQERAEAAAKARAEAEAARWGSARWIKLTHNP